MGRDILIIRSSRVQQSNRVIGLDRHGTVCRYNQISMNYVLII